MLLTNLAETLGSLHGNKDGQLTLYNHDAVLTFYVVKGQLLYVKDEHHPVRRWDRALKQYGCNWNWAIEPSHLLGDRSWECHLLDEGINQEKLSLLRAKLLIRTVAQECLFELNNQKDFESDWKPSQKMASRSWQPIALSSWEMQTISSRAMKMQQEWQTARLGHLSPSLSPILRQGAYHQALPILEKYLNGNFTLWDIAWLLKKSIVEIACDLLILIEKEVLQFQKILDLPLPFVEQTATTTQVILNSKANTPSTASTQKQPLIACIDDSPVLAHALNKILIPAGYQTLNIQEPMRGFGQLIEHKPDLILLDLQLPNADGYSICKFLRDTPVFEKTPIIILTARNTTVDRARARLVGATEFLGKPPQSKELLHIVQKYSCRHQD